ncbi:MAG TPA: hypothetical protein VK850_08445, partial [Candidatus Binatia bacterium]|nr:hypothetical protein [Candidatus Binatia bacterium]
SGTAFFKVFSDTLARAFRWQRSPAPERTTVVGLNPSTMAVLSAPRTWLSELAWQKVLELNHSQCQLQNTEPTPNRNSYETVRQRWDSVLRQPMSLVKALDLCKEAHDKSPFVFSNSSTFCLVAKAMVEELARELPPVEGHILRNTTANYISGRVTKRELIEILKIYESKWSRLTRVAGSNGHVDRAVND